jgi:hypothetical protein
VTVAALKSRIVGWRDLTPALQLSVYSQSVRGRTSPAPAGKAHDNERFMSHPLGSDSYVRGRASRSRTMSDNDLVLNISQNLGSAEAKRRIAGAAAEAKVRYWHYLDASDFEWHANRLEEKFVELRVQLPLRFMWEGPQVDAPSPPS